MQGALAALRKVNFDWTAHIDQIWRDQPHETQNLQADSRRDLADRLADFWDTVLLGYLRSLQQQLSDGKRQVDHWLVRMIAKFGQGVKKSEAIPQQRPPGLINRIDELIAGVRQHHAEVQEHSDVLRAL